MSIIIYNNYNYPPLLTAFKDHFEMLLAHRCNRKP